MFKLGIPYRSASDSFGSLTASQQFREILNRMTTRPEIPELKWFQQHGFAKCLSLLQTRVTCFMVSNNAIRKGKTCSIQFTKSGLTWYTDYSEHRLNNCAPITCTDRYILLRRCVRTGSGISPVTIGSWPPSFIRYRRMHSPIRLHGVVLN
jgi:hypothetical protein